MLRSNARAADNARRMKQATKPWIVRLARLGFAAKGAVYIIVGLLASHAALGRGGGTTDPRGALHTIAARSYGSFLLALVAIGLIGYALWRFVEAWVDPEGKGTDAQGVLTRL